MRGDAAAEGAVAAPAWPRGLLGANANDGGLRDGSVAAADVTEDVLEKI